MLMFYTKLLVGFMTDISFKSCKHRKFLYKHDRLPLLCAALSSGSDLCHASKLQTKAEKEEYLSMIKHGQLDIVVGTHALLGSRVVYNNLGLLVVDEEQVCFLCISLILYEECSVWLSRSYHLVNWC